MAEVQLPYQPKNMTSNRYHPKNILEIRGYSGLQSSQSFAKKKLEDYKAHQSLLEANRNIDTNEDNLIDLVQNIPNNTLNDESNEGWTSTGDMSDSSTVYSIDDGDFDREASKRVNNQLKEIESILYENNSYRPVQIEYKEWLEKFPHLRVLGSQINTVPKEEGFAYFENKQSIQSPLDLYNLNADMLDKSKTLDESKDTKLTDTSMSPSNQCLYVNGTGLLPMLVDNAKNPSTAADYKFLEEEVFDEEGTYEELFAYDNREDEYAFENKRLNLTKRRRRNLPPITPKAAVKDLVLNLLFDILWSEIISWSSDTIRRYAISISPSLEEQPSPYLQTLQKSNTSASFNPNQRLESAINNNPVPLLLNHMTYPMAMQPVPHQSNTILPKTNPIQFSTSNSSNLSKNLNLSFSTYNNVTNVSATNNNDNNIDGFLSIHPFKESNIYLLSNKNSRSYTTEYAANTIDRSAVNSTLDHISEHISGLDNFLQIKQFKNGSLSANKQLPSVVSNSRLGSGVRKYSLKKRLIQSNDTLYPSKTLLDTIHDKNISIHGAAVGKPAPVSNENISNRQHFHPSPLQQVEINKMMNYYGDEFYDDENEYYDHSVIGMTNRNIENDIIEDIGLLNNALTVNNILNTNKKHLPPIEKLLTHKALNVYRISSANNSKKRPENIDRPMTTTATRYEINFPKRVPSALISNQRGSTISSLLNNIQITGTGVNRLNSEDINLPLQINQAHSKTFISQFRKKYK